MCPDCIDFSWYYNAQIMAYYYSPFRKSYGKKSSKRGMECAFCDAKQILKQSIKTKSGVVIENDSYLWVVNLYPKFEGHTMVVPKRHIIKIGEETAQETLDREELIAYAAQVLQKAFPRSGIEIFLQTGEGSASSVAHLHWHVVPASHDDPLRSFEKLGHFYTIEPGKERVIVFPLEIKRSPAELVTKLKKHAHARIVKKRKE